jgi:hypothetical protein
VTIRLVHQLPAPEPPIRKLWRLRGLRADVVCLAVSYPHGTDVRVLRRDEIMRSELIRGGPAQVEGRAAEWKAALIAEGWTDTSAT